MKGRISPGSISSERPESKKYGPDLYVTGKYGTPLQSLVEGHVLGVEKV